jgi:energy-coupling factor transporter ATP-binding protein EcfA2
VTPMSPAVESGSFLADRGAALTLGRVRKTFGAKTVLNGVDLHVPAGQYLAIIGRSGCGKSTLLRLIAGLDEPSAGTIEVAGVISRGTEPAQCRTSSCDRKEADYAHGDQHDLRELENAEPEDEQRNPRERRRCFEGLHRRIKIIAGATRVANYGAEHCGHAVPRRNPSATRHVVTAISPSSWPFVHRRERSTMTATGDGITSGVKSPHVHSPCQATSRARALRGPAIRKSSTVTDGRS